MVNDLMLSRADGLDCQWRTKAEPQYQVRMIRQVKFFCTGYVFSILLNIFRIIIIIVGLVVFLSLLLLILPSYY